MNHVVLEAGNDPMATARRAAGADAQIHSGFTAPDEPWDLDGWIAAGSVRTADEAQRALLLAVRGARLVVAIHGSEGWAQAFRADLRRLAGPDRRREPELPLSAEQRQLLDLLAEGRSIADAARELFISLRTANRRIAEARTLLDAGTTSEAVVRYTKARGLQEVNRPEPQ